MFRPAIVVFAVLAGGTPLLSAATPPLVPRLVGDSWVIAGNPFLGELTGDKQQPVDFAVWPARDGTWQLWSCVRNTKEPGFTRLFHRWEGKSLETAHWQPRGIAMRADPALGESRGGLQAPHVTCVADHFLMFYGSWEFIGAATSTDGKDFTRRLNSDGRTGLFTEGEGCNTRDPMILKIGSRWHCYYTAFPGQQGAVFCRTSEDTLTWSEPRQVAFGGEAGTNPFAAECPFVAAPAPGEYYLFRTQRYGRDAISRVYHSRDPLDFGLHDDSHLVTSLPVAAPELIQHDGRWFIAYLRPPLDGIKVSRLDWVPAERPRSELASATAKPEGELKVPARVAVRSFAPPAEVNFREPARAYVATNLNGWNLKLERELFEAHPDLAGPAVARLATKLGELLVRLPASSHGRLRTFPVFLLLGEEAKAGGRDNGAEYFQRHAPDHFPLMDPQWGSSLVIYSARNYVQLSEAWAVRVLLHEFAHAWQLEQWPEDQPDILGAFRYARGRGLYRDVRDLNGDIIETAYAAVNQLEYFAELSSVYFLGGEYFPFTRAELRDYDPEGAAMLERLWGMAKDP